MQFLFFFILSEKNRYKLCKFKKYKNLNICITLKVSKKVQVCKQLRYKSGLKIKHKEENRVLT